MKPWPEPPPTSHQFCVLGVPGDEEVRVGGEVVLADARADDRRARERRETARRVLARELLVRGEREAFERVGVDLVAGAVGRDLHPEPAELAVAVERARRSRRSRACRPSAVDAEEEDVAAGDLLLDEAGEELRQP